MQGLGGDRHAEREVLGHRRVGVGAAALVTAPVEEDFLHLHSAHHLHRGVAVIGHQHVLGLHQGTDGHAYGFLADGRRVGADASGALQGHGLLVEQPGQDHLPVQADQQIEVVGPRRQGSEQTALRIEVAGKGYVGVERVHGRFLGTLWACLQPPTLVASAVPAQPYSKRSARASATRAGERLSAWE
ncbi:hypothetical protein FQZ97_851470 [compost metagenome]